jgi:hypothetical protein
VAALVVAGVLTGLLPVAGARLLESAPIMVTEEWKGCQAFPVKGEPGDSTHIRLENPRPETIRVHVALIQGEEWIAPNRSLTIAPGADADLEFSTSAAGGMIQLRSSVKDVHASAELHHASGAASEVHYAYLCLDQFS